MLDAFRARHGAPKRVIAWGTFMGGLVTTALAEHEPRRDRRRRPIRGLTLLAA